MIAVNWDLFYSLFPNPEEVKKLLETGLYRDLKDTQDFRRFARCLCDAKLHGCPDSWSWFSLGLAGAYNEGIREGKNDLSRSISETLGLTGLCDE